MVKKDQIQAIHVCHPPFEFSLSNQNCLLITHTHTNETSRQFQNFTEQSLTWDIGSNLKNLRPVEENATALLFSYVFPHHQRGKGKTTRKGNREPKMQAFLN